MLQSPKDVNRTIVKVKSLLSFPCANFPFLHKSLLLVFFVFCFKILFYLFERARENTEGDKELEKQTFCWAGSWMQGSIPGPWDHDRCKGRHLTNWATRASLFFNFFILGKDFLCICYQGKVDKYIYLFLIYLATLQRTLTAEYIMQRAILLCLNGICELRT